MSVAIDAFLERFDADAVHYVDEALGFAVAMLEVAVDQALDDPRYVRARERRTNDPAQRRAYFTDARFTLITADLDLVPLLAVLVDAEDADMADVVMAAGVHAARDVEVELADLVQVIEVVEALLDRLRDRDRLRVRQRAEIAARAADDVGKQADVGGRQSESARLAPKLDQVALTHVGEHQVLLVRHAQLAEGVAIGKIRDRVHLVAGHVAGRHAGLLQRQRHRRVARPLVRVDVALGPGAEARLRAREILVLQPLIGRPRKAHLDALDVIRGERRRPMLQMRPLGFDLLAEFVDAALLEQDLDARLMDVVAAAV